IRLYLPTSLSARLSTKLNGSQVNRSNQSGPSWPKRRRSAMIQLASCASSSSWPAASRTCQWLRSSDLPKFFSSIPITAPSASSTSWRPRNSNTDFDLIMNRCSSTSGETRKRMSSLIFIFFCLTYRRARPSSVEPGGGTLIRYSFAIGLKTCWISRRFDCSSSARTLLMERSYERTMTSSSPRAGSDLPELGRRGGGWVAAQLVLLVAIAASALLGLGPEGALGPIAYVVGG